MSMISMMQPKARTRYEPPSIKVTLIPGAGQSESPLHKRVVFDRPEPVLNQPRLCTVAEEPRNPIQLTALDLATYPGEAPIGIVVEKLMARMTPTELKRIVRDPLAFLELRKLAAQALGVGMPDPEWLKDKLLHELYRSRCAIDATEYATRTPRLT